MSLETYWLMVPLIGIGLCAAGAFAMWVTHPKRRSARADHEKQMALPL